MGKGVGVHGVFHMAADDTGEAVQSQHGTLAGAAAGDDVIGRAAVEQDGGQNAALDIGQLGLVIGCVHAVVDYLVAHGLHHFFQGGFNDAVLGGLAVLVDECDLHSNIPPFGLFAQSNAVLLCSRVTWFPGGVNVPVWGCCRPVSFSAVGP